MLLAGLFPRQCLCSVSHTLRLPQRVCVRVCVSAVHQRWYCCRVNHKMTICRAGMVLEENHKNTPKRSRPEGEVSWVRWCAGVSFRAGCLGWLNEAFPRRWMSNTSRRCVE